MRRNDFSRRRIRIYIVVFKQRSDALRKAKQFVFRLHARKSFAGRETLFRNKPADSQRTARPFVSSSVHPVLHQPAADRGSSVFNLEGIKGAKQIEIKMPNFQNQLRLWHRFVETRDTEILSELLAEAVNFHSPFVWKPKHGKPMTTAILLTVTEVFEDFRYIREILGKHDWALEFEARVGEFTLRGVDLIRLNAEGKFTDFEVMVRPANALQKLGEEMGKRLAAKGFI